MWCYSWHQLGAFYFMCGATVYGRILVIKTSVTNSSKIISRCGLLGAGHVHILDFCKTVYCVQILMSCNHHMTEECV